jgi:hypothetical protein
MPASLEAKTRLDLMYSVLLQTHNTQRPGELLIAKTSLPSRSSSWMMEAGTSELEPALGKNL